MTCFRPWLEPISKLSHRQARDPSPLAGLLPVVPAHVFQHAPRAPRSRLAIGAPRDPGSVRFSRWSLVVFCATLALAGCDQRSQQSGSTPVEQTGQSGDLQQESAVKPTEQNATLENALTPAIEAWRAAVKKKIPPFLSDPAWAEPAIEKVEKAIATARAEHGEHDPRVAIGYGLLADIHVKRSAWLEAAQVRRRELATLDAAFPDDYRAIYLAVFELYRAYLAVGRIAVAEPYMERAIAMVTARYGAESTEMGSELHMHGQLMSIAGDPVAGEKLLLRALAIFKRSNPSKVNGVLYHMVAALNGQGRTEEANALEAKLYE